MASEVHDYICFKFYEAWREIEQLYKKELGNSVSPQVTYILQFCSLDKDMTINEISADMSLNTSAVSTLIGRMENRGLVKRTHGIKDRRVVNVRLTQEGYDLLTKLRGNIDTIADVISENITKEEKETLFNIVSKISKAKEDNYPL
ncbi:putative HTH-type transcriptional regulator YusO [Nymphon striatum]|nr:putative HTH-type transcriptional regulator YusO [Nymphon striatum]